MGLFGSAGLKSAASSIAQIIASLVGQDVVARSFTATQASGSDAFKATVTGARWHIGPGTTDYLSSNGASTISTPAIFSVTANSSWVLNPEAGSGGFFSGDAGSAATIQISNLRPNADNGTINLGGGRNASGTIVNYVANATSGNTPMMLAAPSFTPASGSGTFSALELRPTINGTSSGTAAALAVASLTNTLTGGTAMVADLGTTSSTYASGFTRLFGVRTDGGIFVSSSDSSGTPGSATSNTASGRAAIAAGAALCQITNSLITASSRVFISPRQRDATGLLPAVTTVTAGSFSVTTTVNCTANLTFDWWALS